MRTELAGNVDLQAIQTYPSIQFIEALLASWLLRASAEIETIARHILSACVPSYLQAAMLKRIEQPTMFPSKTIVLRGRIALKFGFP